MSTKKVLPSSPAVVVAAKTTATATATVTAPINFQQVLNEIPKLIGPGMKYIIMIGFCIVFSVMLSTIIDGKDSKGNIDPKKKPGISDYKNYIYVMTFTISLLLLIYLYVRSGNSDLDPKLVMIIGGSIIIVTIILFITSYTSPSASSTSSIMMQSYIINIILLAIVIVGLAIGYKVLENSAKRMRGWPGFIVNFLFFIPCLLTDFIEYILSEFKSAPNSVFILYIIELILILLYFYIPKLLKLLINKNGITLQHKPVYLNKSTILSNSDLFLLPNSLTSTITSSDISSNTYNSNFGLSMWIYVNNMGIHPLTTNGYILFQNSSINNDNGKPSIEFIGNDEWKYSFSDQLIQYNLLSSDTEVDFEINRYSKKNSMDGVETVETNAILDYRDISYFLESEYITDNSPEISNNLKDANFTTSETFKFLIDAYIQPESIEYSTANTKYKSLLAIESDSTNYDVTYTYSYGINDLKGISKTDTATSIAELIILIQKDLRTYRENIKFRAYADDVSIYDMFSFVTEITQTVKYKGETNFILKTPSQKWNHIVFNYYENNVDLFINGNLERSMDLKNNPIRILPTDIISIGDTNGINGAICNIVYYNIPLTKTKISQIYNTYFMKNPPI
jgi:hypothetical protein